MTAPDLSNYLADLAEQAGDAFRRGRARTVEAAGAYLASVELPGERGAHASTAAAQAMARPAARPAARP